MSITDRRTWLVGTALLAALLLVLSWLLLIGPKRAEAQDLRDQQASMQAANEHLQLKVQQLRAQSATLPQRRAELAELQKQMPADASLPALLRELNQAAKASGVQVQSVTPGTPTTAGAAATAAGGQAAAPSTAPGAGGATATSGLVDLPVSVVVTGNYFNAELFLKAMQLDITRLWLVNRVSIDQLRNTTSAGGPSGNVTLTIAASVFVLPDAATGATATGATATGATATGASGAATTTAPGTGTGTGGSTATGQAAQ